MSQTPTTGWPVDDDTPQLSVPVHERPPYARPWWRKPLLVGAVLALLAACAITALLVRAVWRWVVAAPGSTRPAEKLVVFADPAEPYAGPVYRAEFYDGDYRQLRDVDLRIALPALHGAAADATLDAFARQCAAAVGARDSQRCFQPRLRVFGVSGRCEREWVTS